MFSKVLVSLALVAVSRCDDFEGAEDAKPQGAPSPHHARRTMVIRMTLLTTERLFWHCGAHTARPESASY